MAADCSPIDRTTGFYPSETFVSDCPRAGKCSGKALRCGYSGRFILRSIALYRLSFSTDRNSGSPLIVYMEGSRCA